MDDKFIRLGRWWSKRLSMPMIFSISHSGF